MTPGLAHLLAVEAMANIARNPANHAGGIYKMSKLARKYEPVLDRGERSLRRGHFPVPAELLHPDRGGTVARTPLQAGDSILVRAGLAPAFVYGSIIDNVSQDPSLQFASVLR